MTNQYHNKPICQHTSGIVLHNTTYRATAEALANCSTRRCSPHTAVRCRGGHGTDCNEKRQRLLPTAQARFASLPLHS